MKNKIGTAILALVVSFGLWLYVITVVSPGSEQTYYNIPVVFSGSSLLESRGLMMVSDQNVKMDLTLSGNRTDLNKLSNANITILADLSGITAPGEYKIYYSVAYPGIASTGGITIVDQSMQQISVTVAERVDKEVPVEVIFTGELPSADYVADRQNVVLDHEMIALSGPKAVVEQIEKATITVDLTGKTADFTGSYELVLRDAQGNDLEATEHLTVSATTVQATVKVSLLKTLPIVVEVKPGGGLVADDISYELSYDSILVSGAESLLADLEQIKFVLDLSKIVESGRETYPITLPNGVTNVSGVTEVYLDVQIPEMATETFIIASNQFVYINLPPNMKVDLSKNIQREVTLRGRAHHLESIEASDIQIVIDFADAIPGLNSYEAEVRVEGYEHVTADGEIKIWATLTEISEEETT